MKKLLHFLPFPSYHKAMQFKEMRKNNSKIWPYQMEPFAISSSQDIFVEFPPLIKLFYKLLTLTMIEKKISLKKYC